MKANKDGVMGKEYMVQRFFFYRSDMTLNFDQIFFFQFYCTRRPCKLSEQVLINTDQENGYGYAISFNCLALLVGGYKTYF